MYQAAALFCIQPPLVAIRVNVDNTPIDDRLLQAFPVIGIEKFRMQLVENLAQLGVSEHERTKLLGKNIIRPDRVPRLAGKFLPRRRCLGNMAEVALREVAHLVVVVEDHTPMASHTEILQQHIAREDIRRSHLLDGVAVVFKHCAGLDLIALFQIEVEGNHHALGIAVLDNDLVTLELYGRRRDLQQVFEALRIEVILARNEIGKFLGVGHAANPVMTLHQLILLAHDIVSDILGRVETVLDDLEHRTKQRQHKHRHHHATHTRGDNELVFTLGHLTVERTEKLGLAMLEEAYRRIELTRRLARHQLLQVIDELARHRHLNLEVRPSERENNRDLILFDDHRIEVQPLVRIMQNRQHQRHLLTASANPSYQIGTLVAIEHTFEQLDLGVRRFKNGLRQVLTQKFATLLYIALKVAERSFKLRLAQPPAQHSLPVSRHCFATT